MMTGSLKKKKIKKKKKKKFKRFFFFLNFKKGGGSLIRACSLIRSNTVNRLFYFVGREGHVRIGVCGHAPPNVLLCYMYSKKGGGVR